MFNIGEKYCPAGYAGRLLKSFGICAAGKEVELIEGNARPDHIRIWLRVPPKYSMAMAVGYLKGKSAIRIL